MKGPIDNRHKCLMHGMYLHILDSGVAATPEDIASILRHTGETLKIDPGYILCFVREKLRALREVKS